MTFTNPVLPGCHPDPSICRVGEDYYLVTSTFEYWPGLPVFHSRDLVHWLQIGHAIDRPDQVDLSTVPSSGGLFAATIRHHDGFFFIACTLVHGQGRRGNFVLTASDPAGPWSDPLWLDEAPGIDPSLFFDHDGRAWMTGTRLAEPGLWPGHTDVWLRELRIERDPVRITLIGEEHLLWRGALHGAVWAEGPHLYRVDGRYYLVAAEGGTEHDHAVSVAAADAVTGPYVGNPANPVLTHRHLGRGFGVTGVGHADLVEHADGSWWAVVLGSRPVGADGAQPLGRETFLVPVEWQNGWPVFAPGVGHIAAPFEAPSPSPSNATPFAAPSPRQSTPLEAPSPRQSTPCETSRATRAAVPSGVASDVPTLPHGSSAPPFPWTFVRTTSEPRAIFGSDPEAFGLIPRPVTLADVGAPTFVARRQQHHRASFEATFTLWSPADLDPNPGPNPGTGTGSETDTNPGTNTGSGTDMDIDPGMVAGVAVRQSESNWLALSVALAPDPKPRAGDPRGATPSERTVAVVLTLTECQAGVERILDQRSVPVTAAPDDPDPSLTLFLDTDDGRYGFGARVPHGHLPEPPPLEPTIHLTDVDGTFLTSPVAGGFLGLWLGVFAVRRPDAGAHPSPPVVQVSHVRYRAG